MEFYIIIINIKLHFFSSQFYYSYTLIVVSKWWWLMAQVQPQTPITTERNCGKHRALQLFLRQG